MLLTITYRGEKARDLGCLLHKNPDRAQKFEISFGQAYVFYTEATDEVTTAALLIDINPIDLARGKAGTHDEGLFDYVNDRPYVASSFMSTAMSKVFSTAMNGRCDKRPELAASALDLEANLTMLPCRADTELVRRIFEPLGYTVSFDSSVLDEKFPEWGDSRYINLNLRGHVRLCDLLNHLYVLIPVFDLQKHYWIADDEVEKLMKHGEGWLNSHPEMRLITNRYFSRKKGLAHQALERLIEKEEIENAIEESVEAAEAGTDEQEAPAKPDVLKEKRISLNEQRLRTAVKAVLDSGATSVADLGCGEGRLLSLLIKERQITKLTGLDVSVFALERAKDRLHYDRLPDYQKNKLTLYQGSLTYRDKRLEGYDTVCVMEVIEHIDPNRLPAFERAVFEYAAPKTVILSTPNAEYNVNYEKLNAESFRHEDHRFEWSRAEFKVWADAVCARFGYEVSYTDIGELDETVGAPTQMGVFTKCE